MSLVLLTNSTFPEMQIGDRIRFVTGTLSGYKPGVGIVRDIDAQGHLGVFTLGNRVQLFYLDERYDKIHKIERRVTPKIYSQVLEAIELTLVHQSGGTFLGQDTTEQEESNPYYGMTLTELVGELLGSTRKAIVTINALREKFNSNGTIF